MRTFLLSNQKRLIAAAFGLLALFLLSGALPASAFSSLTNASSSSASTIKSTPLPGNAGLSFSSASKLLIGPFGPYSATAAAPAVPLTIADSSHVVPHHGLARDTSNAANPIPTVNCPGAGCDAVSASSGGAVGAKGLNALDDLNLFPGLGNVEPADQGICAGNGHVVETNNQGEVLVFNTALKRESASISLDNLMGLTQIPANMGGPWSSGGDPSCLYDYNNGGHWFITEIVSTNSEASGGPFTGCFAAVASACYEGIAVSVTSNPLGKYYIYFFNANYNSKEPGYPYQLNDFAKIATTRDAFLLFYDEFPLRGGGLGGNFFNGAQELAFTKTAMEKGLSVTSNTFNVAIENMGLYKTPDGACPGSINGGLICWYQVIPAQAPDPTQYDNSHGGSGFMFASLDFTGAGDNRVAVFYWTGLSDLGSSKCSTCSNIHFGGALFSGALKYFDPGVLAQQKAGPTPLGNVVYSFDNNACTAKCPVGPIATNGDGATQASFAQGQIWSAISTLVGQKYGAAAPENHVGAAYWVIGTSAFDTAVKSGFTVSSQAYVTAMHEDLEFPSMAAGGTAAQDGGNGEGVIAFTLSGADYYPSTAFGTLTSTSGGLLEQTINVADMGQAPQDGFTEYDCLNAQAVSGHCPFASASYRPRWGDYSNAIFLPFSGGKVYFATNYIQSPNCGDLHFVNDPTCGGTRAKFANWGTSVNYVVP